MENIKDEIANDVSQIKSKLWGITCGQAHYDIRILLYEKMQWPVSSNIRYGSTRESTNANRKYNS
jgi:hypothetical protein